LFVKPNANDLVTVDRLDGHRNHFVPLTHNGAGCQFERARAAVDLMELLAIDDALTAHRTADLVVLLNAATSDWAMEMAVGAMHNLVEVGRIGDFGRAFHGDPRGGQRFQNLREFSFAFDKRSRRGREGKDPPLP
jgi:hypothetical protein